MSLLYPFVLFLLFPLFFYSKRNKSLLPKHSKRERLFLYISLTLMVFSLSRPVLSNTLNKQKFDAQDYIVAIDASFSMQATDLKPSRYKVAKENLKSILTALPQNRFSIFAFTSNAILISPPTTDTAISLMALNSLQPKYILTKGTSLKTLLKTVARTSYKRKNLIIFSDGGEDYELNILVNLAKTNHIIPYVVATGSKNGAILRKNDKNVKDENSNLVISRINPILESFASLSGGKYYALTPSNADISTKIVRNIKSSNDKKKKSDINVVSYKELFYFPLFLSLLFFMMAVTKVHQLYIFLPLFFTPNIADSKLLDFYHIHNASSAFHKKDYIKSAKEYEKSTPTLYSFYNRALAYYKAGHYKEAVEIFATIRTKDAKLKQKIFYNMGNCAVKLKKIQRAKIYYQKALAFGEDKDALFNLMLLYKHRLKDKKDVSNMLPKNEVKKKTAASKKRRVDKTEKKNKASKNRSSNSKQKASQSSNGSSNSKNKKQVPSKKTDKTINTKYKIGYKAYELINKGYTNEKHPW